MIDVDYKERLLKRLEGEVASLDAENKELVEMVFSKELQGKANTHLENSPTLVCGIVGCDFHSSADGEL